MFTMNLAPNGKACTTVSNPDGSLLPKKFWFSGNVVYTNEHWKGAMNLASCILQRPKTGLKQQIRRYTHPSTFKRPPLSPPRPSHTPSPLQVQRQSGPAPSKAIS